MQVVMQIEMKYNYHNLELEIGDEWLKEMKMSDFKSFQNQYSPKPQNISFISFSYKIF
jgi:hypothetical protein